VVYVLNLSILAETYGEFKHSNTELETESTVFGLFKNTISACLRIEDDAVSADHYMSSIFQLATMLWSK